MLSEKWGEIEHCELPGWTSHFRAHCFLSGDWANSILTPFKGKGISTSVSESIRMTVDPPSGSDEGEIIESESEKATTSLPSVDDTNVDRHSRTRVSVAESSNDRDSSLPYRDRSLPRRDHSPRGEKRPRDDDHYHHDHRRPDARQFKVHYEARFHDERRRSRVSYADLDYGDSSNSYLRYDDRPGDNRYRDARARIRSRSPGRVGRTDHRRAREERGRVDDRRDTQGLRRGDWDYHGSRNQRVQMEKERITRPPSVPESRRQTEEQIRGSKQAVSREDDKPDR